jgi:hypothetical protein
MSGGGDYRQEHLIKMANQIAHSVPSRDDVSGQISQHMRQFWTPGMRELLAQIAKDTPEQLSAEVHAALDAMR